MDQVMNRIAGLYQDDIDNRMNTALAVLEPTLVIALSLIVGVILLSVMLPLMGIMSSL
jgi:type IV pilus assembly protein PilC